MSLAAEPVWLRSSADPSVIDAAGCGGNAMTIWHRTPSAQLRDAVEHIPHEVLPNARWSGPVDGLLEWTMGQFRGDSTSSQVAMETIALDAVTLAQWFDRRCQATTYMFRWHRLDDTMCPRFHTDRGPMRLLCTYRGPGTEWAPDEAIDHRALNTRGTENADIVPDPSSVQTVPLFAGAVLCGCDARNRGGVVHRSPAVPPGVSRLTFCMTLT